MARSLPHVVALVTLILGCSEAAPAPSPSACPATFRPDPERTARLRALLPPSSVQAEEVCFGGAGPSAITSEGVVLLEAAWSDASCAARLAHLRLHISDGPPLRSDPQRTCDDLVDDALQRESRAYALELRIRDELGAGPSPYTDLEVAFRAGGRAAVYRYLRDNPRGGPGLDGLGWGYHMRCEDERE